MDVLQWPSVQHFSALWFKILELVPFFISAGFARHSVLASAKHGEASNQISSSGKAGHSRPDAASAARFQHLILPHLEAAHNLARFLSRDSDAAEDIVQEAFLRAFKSFEEFRGGNARAWILTIVRNCHHNWWNGRRRASRLVQPENHVSSIGGVEGDFDTFKPSELVQDADTPETNLLRCTEAEMVRLIIETLPETFREVLVLRELEDMSYREISEVVDVPVGTVMSRLARARKMFEANWQRQVLRQEGAP
jgi:RNA polymerase sigma-70 factor (ECF subfamily)